METKKKKVEEEKTEELQTTFNNDPLEELLEGGEVENVQDANNETEEQ